MKRHGLDDQAAFTRLRRQVRSTSRKLTEVAHRRIPDDPEESTSERAAA